MRKAEFRSQQETLWPAERSSSLVIVANEFGRELWRDSTGGLAPRVQSMLPGVHISVAGNLEQLNHALAAAAFIGSGRVVVVKLWGSQPAPRLEIEALGATLGVEIVDVESPPDAPAIVSAFALASVELAPCA